jgi:uncharacterized protein YjbI with pentapeptide repeats
MALPSIPGDPTWTSQEQWVWERMQAGAIADFNTPEGYRGPGTLEELQDWSPKRILRPVFLKALLVQEPYCTAIPLHGIRIRGAWFRTRLDLSHITLTHLLWLEYSRFESAVRLIAVRTAHWFSLEGSALHGAIEMSEMHVERHLSITGATVTGALSMHGLHVGGHLLGQGATFTAVDLTGAHIEGQLDLTQAKVSGPLTMNGLHVGRSLFMDQGATFTAVDLTNAQIEGQLDLTQAEVSGPLTMNSLHVGRSLFMDQGATFTAVDLTGAHIEGQFDLTQAKVSGLLTMARLHVGGDLFMGQSVFTQGKPEPTIELYYATIGGNLDLSGASLPSLNLTSTKIGGDLRFALHARATWASHAQLHLYNTAVVGMQDVTQASPRILRLEGFTYNRLEELTTAASLSKADQQGLLKLWTDWLENQPYYAPQPYEQLASVIQEAGYKRMAIDILYQSKNRERRQTAFGRVKAGLWLSWLLIGYGYHNFWVLWWVVGFAGLGCAVLCLSGEAAKLGRTDDVLPFSIDTPSRIRLAPRLFSDHESPLFLVDTPPRVRLEPRLLPSDIFPFSLSMLLPIIKLNKKYEDVVPHLTWGVRYYFYGHQIVGYVLASFLVAGLAGLTKK